MKTNESVENYLETILSLQSKNGIVRSIDIAHELSFSKPSVSVAMKNLREKNYIEVDDNGHITLTDTGQKIAENISERHRVVAAALMALGVTEETAVLDSCKIEHVISEESFVKIREHLKTHNHSYSRSGDIDVVLL